MIDTLRELKPQESVVYYTGVLSRDIITTDSEVLTDLRNYAYDLYKAGVVDLVQRRLFGDTSTNFKAQYEYVAVGRSYPRQSVKKYTNINGD